MPQVKTLRVAFRYDMLFGITPNQDINFRREFFSFLHVLFKAVDYFTDTRIKKEWASRWNIGARNNTCSRKITIPQRGVE